MIAGMRREEVRRDEGGGGEEGRRHNMNYDLYVTTNVQGPSYFNKKNTNKIVL